MFRGLLKVPLPSIKGATRCSPRQTAFSATGGQVRPWGRRLWSHFLSPAETADWARKFGLEARGTSTECRSLHGTCILGTKVSAVWILHLPAVRASLPCHCG